MTEPHSFTPLQIAWALICWLGDKLAVLFYLCVQVGLIALFFFVILPYVIIPLFTILLRVAFATP